MKSSYAKTNSFSIANREILVSLVLRKPGCSVSVQIIYKMVWVLITFDDFKAVLAHLMIKYKYIQGFGQGQKYWSDPDVLTLVF